MRLAPFAVAMTLGTIAVSFAARVATQGGVGAVEYVAAVALVAGLVLASVRLARSALRPR